MSQPAARAPYAIAFGPLAICLVLLVGAGRALVARMGLDGLTPLFALWLVALPLCLGRLRANLRAELPAAVCLFAVVGGVHMLDEILETRLAINGFFLLCGLWHLWRHRRQARALLRSPIAIALLLFVVQQLLSAWFAGSSDLPGIARDRALMLLMFACTAVLVSRPDGQRLAPALIVFATLMSLPVMLQEMADPIRGLTEDGRAGGFWGQANVAGILLSYGVACAAALHLEGVISAGTLAALYVPLFVGVLCTASRGALINALGAVSVAWIGELHRRWGRRGLVTALASVAAFALLLAPLSDELARANNQVDEVSSANAERLQDTLLALSGSSAATDDMMAHDSGRTTLADEALALIARQPLFGYGTGNFMQESARSHVQYLEVLGENGVVGAALYLALLLTIATALMRMPERTRLCAAVVITPWLLTHFHNHNVVESLQINVALGYVAGLATVGRVDARATTA
jgi:O-antigen ligase